MKARKTLQFVLAMLCVVAVAFFLTVAVLALMYKALPASLQESLVNLRGGLSRVTTSLLGENKSDMIVPCLFYGLPTMMLVASAILLLYTEADPKKCRIAGCVLCCVATAVSSVFSICYARTLFGTYVLVYIVSCIALAAIIGMTVALLIVAHLYPDEQRAKQAAEGEASEQAAPQTSADEQPQQTAEQPQAEDEAHTVEEIIDKLYGKKCDEIDATVMAKISKLHKLYEEKALTEDEYMALLKSYLEI